MLSSYMEYIFHTLLQSICKWELKKLCSEYQRGGFKPAACACMFDKKREGDRDRKVSQSLSST